MTGIIKAEILKTKTDVSQILLLHAKPDVVIVIVKNGVAVNRQRGLLGNFRLVMQILDAAERAAVEAFPLLGLGFVAVGDQIRRRKARSSCLMSVPPS